MQVHIEKDKDFHRLSIQTIKRNNHESIINQQSRKEYKPSSNKREERLVVFAAIILIAHINSCLRSMIMPITKVGTTFFLILLILK